MHEGWQSESFRSGAGNSRVNGQTVLHKGAKWASYEDVQRALVPVETDTFKPLPHRAFVDLMKTELTARKVDIVAEKYAMNKNGMQLFGMFDLATVAPSGDFRAVMGFRNSNDRTWAAGIVAGSRVFVCDNLAFSGDFFCLRKKHTPGLDIGLHIGPAIDRFEDNFDLLVGLSEHLKTVSLSDTQAKELMVDLCGAKLFPLRLLPEVRKQWLEPEYPVFEDRTAWSLYNAFTESAKIIKSTATLQRSLSNLSRTMRTASGYRCVKPVDDADVIVEGEIELLDE